jgi:hypothetical protein
VWQTALAAENFDRVDWRFMAALVGFSNLKLALLHCRLSHPLGNFMPQALITFAFWLLLFRGPTFITAAC